MELNTIFDKLWTDYSFHNPSAAKIYRLFTTEGELVVNDHIAFRTLDLKEIDIDILAKPFTSKGYVHRGEYNFPDKHLYARHYEFKGSPRIFISQLQLEKFSPFLQKTLKEGIEKSNLSGCTPEELIFSGSVIRPVSFKTYDKLRKESEYAAWFYVFGFRANHFTVSINSLKKYNTIQSVNDLLKKNGFPLNRSGGEIKGTPAELLQQSSTLADRVIMNFTEGEYEIPCCYYEFAQRYKDNNGKLYNGFIAASADKIFESTDFHLRKLS